MKKYTGNEKCSGCGVSGKDNPRNSRESLCNKCANDIVIGRQLSKDFDRKEFCLFSIRWYFLKFYDKDFGEKIEKSFYSLFEALHREVPWGERISMFAEAVTASKQVIIPTKAAKALEEIINSLNIQQAEFRKQKEGLEKERLEMIKNERNKIFNEGVEYGRSILIQLNNGDMSLKDFEKEKSKY